ncbi:MAG: DoxX family protein [Candidatus Latescibacterota bacterium]|nr:DoxX family protein [Candidatus Latescibacterota bacterium]
MSVILSWIAQVIAAVILGQTLFFKFAGSAESKHIFETLGVEPWGRYLTGSLEAVAVVLLLMPRTAVFGAILALGLMSGAIFSHVTKLGIVVQDDGGLLFGLAITVFVCAAMVIVIRRGELPFWPVGVESGAAPLDSKS